MEGEREGKHLGAVGTSDVWSTPLFSVSTPCACGLLSMASPPLPQSSCYACSHS